MSYLYTSVFCCAVGYVAWFAVAAATLGQAMIVSFSIGLSINTASVVLRKVIQSYVGFFPSAVLITLLGLVVGLVIGGTLALNDPMGRSGGLVRDADTAQIENCNGGAAAATIAALSGCDGRQSRTADLGL